MELIKLNDALKIMSSGELFEIKYISYDKRRNTGGKIKHFFAKQNSTEASKKGGTDKQSKTSKNPKHYKNFTRSLRIYVDGIETSNIRKCHIYLIIELNGKKVYL